MGFKMYKRHDKTQLSVDEYCIPFGDVLSADIRWVKIAKLLMNQ